jgi:hypothetical protein
MMLDPNSRKLALTAHVTTSVGWLGAAAAFLVLAIAGPTTGDPSLARGSYVAMGAVLTYAITPFAVGALLTGIVSALGTPWRLFNHYWVVIKLVLTTMALGVLLVQLAPIQTLAATAADPASSLDDFRGNLRPLVHSTGGVLVLLLIQLLGIYKPRGLTPNGRRRSVAERKAEKLA